MQIFALVESVDHVCCRYRLTAFRPALHRAGYALELCPIPKSLFARVRLFRSLRAADAVIVQRKLLPGFEVTLLRRWARKLIFDFDDAVWLRDSYSAKGFESARRTRRFEAIAEAADLIVAGNEFLAAEAARHSGAVAVVPTCVNTAAYPLADPGRSSDALSLVWVGSSSTLRGLERFRDTLEAIGKGVPGTRLRLICDRFLKLEHLPVEAVPWSKSTEATEIAASDVGIGWVPDDPWSRGKCGLKILQYQAAGLPVVANAVGVQSTFVRDGVTGYIAETPEQWVSAIRRLADGALRRELGANGRAMVDERYSVSAGGEAWLGLLDQLLRGTRRAAG